MRSLIVDDELISQNLLQSVLSEYGECSVAADGKEALNLFVKALYSDNPYTLICLDILMPKLDGHETLTKIREYESEKGIDIFNGVNVIMITAVSGYNDIKKAYENQCGSYLVKPITKEKLIFALKELSLIE